MHYELQIYSFISGHYINRDTFPFFPNLQLLEGHSFFHLINTYSVITVFQELQNWKEQNGGEDYIRISAGMGLRTEQFSEIAIG